MTVYWVLLLLLLGRIIRKQLFDIVRQFLRNLRRLAFIISIDASPDQVATFTIHQIDNHCALGEMKSLETTAASPTAWRKTFDLSFVCGTKSEIYNQIGSALNFGQSFSRELRSNGVFDLLLHKRA